MPRQANSIHVYDHPADRPLERARWGRVAIVLALGALVAVVVMIAAGVPLIGDFS